MITAIITAAGRGRRMGESVNKVFLPLNGRPVLIHTVMAVTAPRAITHLIVTAAEGEEDDVRELLAGLHLAIPWEVVTGGEERQNSIENALRAVPSASDFVLVHDGARPLISAPIIDEVIKNAIEHQAALVAVKVKDTVKESSKDVFVKKTLKREFLWAVQTPQAFQTDILRQAYRQAEEDGYLGTDDASLVERIGVKVKIVSGDYRNIKITTPEDMILAESFLKETQKYLKPKEYASFRVGIGYDVHRLVRERKLILGGVEIAHTHGLLGHSDADVLLHAIKDALLGAAALGDIGRHFPDTKDEYKGISSLRLLEEVRKILKAARFKVNNVDATIVAEKPKLAPYIPEMNRNIAEALAINTKNVNIKATSTEGLGFAGRQEGIAAYATVSVVLS
jgi:2-C-methyl-D-erythritol 4-phosphate cytidylyltransferase/2-C-methyl-D-erythritol 2,4-cyclodiphosphate synthase